MPDVTGMIIKETKPINLYGAFYQTPYDDEPRIKDLRALLEMISNNSSDEVHFIEIDAEYCVAFGFMNITKLKPCSAEIYNRDAIVSLVKSKLVPILDDITLETDSHIYDLGVNINVYLDYTLVK